MKLTIEQIRKMILEEIRHTLIERGGGVRPLPRQVRRILQPRDNRPGQPGDQIPMRGYWNPQTKRIEPQVSMPSRAGDVLPFRRPEEKPKTQTELEPQKVKQGARTKTDIQDPLEESKPCVAEFKRLWMLYKESLGREDFINDVNTWVQNNRATPCEIDLFFAGLCSYAINNTSYNYQIGRFSIPLMGEQRTESGRY